MKLSTALFASVVAICCLSCSVDTGDTSIHTDDMFSDTKKAAEQGDALAQTMLGSIYANGDFGVPKDDTEAVMWYRKAAEQGNAYAQYVLGLKYELGEGVSQDYVEAYMWFNIAESNDDKQAKETRDKLLPKMSQEQIAEAQTMSTKWLEDFEKKNKE